MKSIVYLKQWKYEKDRLVTMKIIIKFRVAQLDGISHVMRVLYHRIPYFTRQIELGDVWGSHDLTLGPPLARPT